MSANDANNSSEVNRGQSDISATPNSSPDFVALNSAASSTQPNSAPMVERKTTSATDITDPNTRREMARRMRMERRRAKHELRKKHKEISSRTDETYRSNKKNSIFRKMSVKHVLILTIPICIVSSCSAIYFVVTNSAAREEDIAFEEFVKKDEEIIRRVRNFDNMSYADAKETILNEINNEKDKEQKYLLIRTYYSLASYYFELDDMLDAIKMMDTGEYTRAYQKEDVICDYINYYGASGDELALSRYREELKKLPRRYNNKDCEYVGQ